MASIADLLAMAVSMRGSQPPVRPNQPNDIQMVPPTWWQGGGPPRPPVMGMPTLGGAETPGYDLGGRTRLRPEMLGSGDDLSSQIPMASPMPQPIPRALQPPEQIAPRRYGRGQVI